MAFPPDSWPLISRPLVSGQYASEGSGACLDCKTEGDKNYADTEGSSSCKQCDGEVDSGRTFCLQRDRTLPPSDGITIIGFIV